MQRRNERVSDMGAYDNDVYGEPTVYQYEDGVIVRAYHPILTPEEYERRLNDLKDATADYLRHVADMNGGKIPKYEHKELKAKIISE